MATNKKKIFVTESMSQQGRALLDAREDIELVEFPNMISQPDFQAKLKEPRRSMASPSAAPVSVKRSWKLPGTCWW